MGFASRRPVLPAPTESSVVESAEDTGLGTDLATDLSRRTDRTSHTIPDDGRPITVATNAKRSTSGKLTKTNQHSQTSLLIEYYEGGKDPNSSSRQPSVRVRVTPSASRKNKDKKDGQIVVTETRGSRQPSYSRRISLGTDSPARVVDPGSVSSLESLNQTRAVGKSPLDIEILQKEGSDLSGTSVSREARFIVAPSDISSMPADSLLDGPTLTQSPTQQTLSSDKMAEIATLNVPSGSHNRSLSGERFSQKVIEKLSNKPRATTSGRRRHSDKTRNRSVSNEVQFAEEQASRQKSSKRREEDSNADSSVVTNSLLSAGHKSGDQASFRSGTSQSSLNNPRLLQTVEDAIRRLILPELKELKKDQKNASRAAKYDRETDPSDLSASSISREQVVQSYDEKGRSKVVPSRNNKDAGDVLSSGSRHRHRRNKEVDLESPSDRSYRRRESVDSLSVSEDHDHEQKSKKSHRLRDAAAGAIAGGVLTAAALKHHDSGSTLERDERRRRRKRSKSRSSRSASIAESEEIFHKHDVPPMPMRSEIDSELTRSSLLSQKTAGTATPTHREVREVIRGSPREIISPASRTPTMTPADSRRGLGTYHGNLSERDLSAHKEELERDVSEDKYPQYGGAALGGLAAGGLGALAAAHILDDPERVRKYESNLHHQHPIRRGLSPIQSVASYTTTEPNRTSVIQARSIDSLGSLKKQQQLNHEMSIGSLSSAPSTDLARSKRPQGISLENRSEIMDQLPGTPKGQARNLDVDDFYDEQHSQNDRYRESYASSDPKIDVQRMTNYTDDSMDAPYLDKVTAGQQVTRGYGGNPEYIHTPPAVESAVASLYDPSLVDLRDQSPAHSYTESLSQQDLDSPGSAHRDYNASHGGSPLKEQHSAYSQEDVHYDRDGNALSPPPKLARFIEYDDDLPAVQTSHSAPKGLDETLENQDATSPESEITTNPSVIQGPMGGTKHIHDPWQYGETPPRTEGNLLTPQGMSRDLGVADSQLYPDPLNTGISQNKEGIYASNPILSTPLGAKDEGYVTADNPTYSPRPKDMGFDNFAPAEVDLDGMGDTDDPFTSKKTRYLSGMSHGMNSPLYDSSTGRGIERIQSKDIVALMDHLTVRDAQRNARDTEILVTLVRSAAEMRNSFEDMKKFIAEQDDLVMDTADQQHEKTQKIIGGPRPPPFANARFTRSVGSEDDDGSAKRKNVFKRALQGLGSKNSRELQNIEQMLVQLLGEVEGLRTSQEIRPAMNNAPVASMQSVENTRAPTDTGYEPEGQAGTSSTGDRSGFFSNNSSRQADYRGAGGRRESGNRVSTVIEGDEEYDQALNDPAMVDQSNENTARFRAANRDTWDPNQTTRGTSVPVSTPPRPQQQATGALSAENTPRMSTEGSSNRKHKSTGSSFFPRISRWSKTTASSVADNFRSSGHTVNKPRPYSQVSHSGSNLDEYDYDHKGDDRLRSNHSLADEQYRDQENRPPSPLIPSQVSEKPKYQAHRNSLNLQHPQPRQGPTGRYQHHLETEAQNYGEDTFSPTSQTSSHWEQQVSSAPVNSNTNPQGHYSSQGHLSPISDGYSETSSARMQQGRPTGLRSAASADSMGSKGPPRPPKIRDDDPLVPQRPPKVAMTPPGNRQTTYVDHVAAARAGSPAFDKTPVAALRSSPGQARKPSGPRPISGSAQYTKGGKGELGPVKRTRFRGSPNQIDSEEDVAN